jgi:riboflavin biosynthesis pyrimidine reductase
LSSTSSRVRPSWAPSTKTREISAKLVASWSIIQAARLLDEIVINLTPVLLGEGVRFFESPDTGRVNLERISVDLSGQMTDLRFRVLK